MPRLIKRYGSRKLYDTSDSRYVSLEEVAAFVRAGDDIEVVENKTGDDVTAAILTQIISEEGRNGQSTFSPRFLHDLLRAGESAIKKGEEVVEAGLQRARQGVGEIARTAADRVRPASPMSDVRDEMDRLRARLESLETTLNGLDRRDAAGADSETN
ncbi:MAG: polyhydroxyalkanoate synthesis regulator DNA-binding domain-containing protein [Rubricoccaceae bacterium]